MKSIFRATAILSGSSIISILLGIVSAKVLALFLQPAGYGYYGLLQSFVGVTTLLAGLGMSTGLVRLGARAATQNDEAALASLNSGAWLLFIGLGSLTLALLSVFRVTLSRWALGSPDHGWTIVLMGIALLFMVAANIQVGTLNAHHRVGALAKYGVVNTLGSGLFTITAILIWRMHGIVPAVIFGAAVSWGVSRFFLQREVKAVRVRPTRKETFDSAFALARFGGPFTLSLLVGTGVQLALPMVVVHLLNPESVGYYKAAAAISVGYLGFLVTAMGQDYYPRISAVSHQPEALVKLINEQHRLVMLIAVPIILGMLALVPILIPIVYSHKFTPAVNILEWQLIGDLFKFSSWTMSFAILARCRSSVYFLTESIGGAAMLAATWLGVRWFGMTGLGVSFLASYVIYYLAVWVVIRREVPLVWTASNKKMMLGAVAAALIIRILPSTRLAAFRTPVALALALIAGVPSLFILWREFMAGKTGIVNKIPEEVPQKAATRA
jgi:PST family polysaccharide transporter